MRVFSTIVDLVRLRATEKPSAMAYAFLADNGAEQARLNWQELDTRAQAIACQLQQFPVAPGERVLILCSAGLEFIVAFFAALYAGCVAVPAIRPRRQREEERLPGIVEDCRPKAVLATADLRTRRGEVLAAIPSLGNALWLAVDQTDAGTAGKWSPPPVQQGSLAFLQYTSGSTGTPKGVRVTHGNLMHNEGMIQQAFGQDEESVVVGWLPLYHDMGLIGNVLQPLYVGGRAVLMSPASFLRRPVSWLEVISRFRATTAGGPNFAYDLCADRVRDDELHGLDLSTWKLAFNGSEPVRAATLERFAQRFAVCGFQRRAFYPCYGLAETTLFVTGGDREQEPVVREFSKANLEIGCAEVVRGDTRVETVALVGSGRAWMAQDVVIVDPENSREVTAGKVGEIWVSGPSVADGYWGRSENSAEIFEARRSDDPKAGPYLRTGDLGFFESGELFVTGREKDLIILRGRNIYPQDVELTAESSHDALRRGAAAAFAIDDGEQEKLVVAIEVDRRAANKLAADATAVERVMEAIRRAVAERHEAAVFCVALLKTGTLPKTSSGKVRRRACRQGFLAGKLQLVGSSQLDTPATQRYWAADPEIDPGIDAAMLCGLPSEQRRASLGAYLQGLAAEVLRVPRERIDLHTPLTGLGLDSLAAMELAHRLESDLGKRPELTDLLAGATLEQVQNEILEALGSAAVERSPVFPSTPSAQDVELDQPLSHGQRALWLIHQLAPHSSADHIVAGVRIHGTLAVAALQRALAWLVERHPVLAARFLSVQGEPVQRLESGDREGFDFHLQEAEGWSAQQIDDVLTREARRPFDLARGRLLRVLVVRASEREHFLLLAVHHIVADFWSMVILANELEVAYLAEIAARAPALRPLTSSFSAWVRAEEERLAGEVGARLLSFWSAELGGELPVLDLPTDRPRPPFQTYAGGVVRTRLPTASHGVIEALAQKLETTLYTTLLAAFQLTLARYTGLEDVLVGSPTAGRLPATRDLVGLFVHPVVVRGDLRGDPSFRELLARIRTSMLRAFRHRDYPFELLVQHLQPSRESGHHPIFQVFFTWQQALPGAWSGVEAFAFGQPGRRFAWGGLEWEPHTVESGGAQFDLSLVAGSVAGEMPLLLHYNRDLFDVATVERMLAHFTTLLEGVTANPEQPLAAFSLLRASERRELLHMGCGRRSPARDHGLERCLHELIREQAERMPNRVAVTSVEGDGTPQAVTYGALLRAAERFGHRLRSVGARPEEPVALMLDRSAAMVVGLLGILEAGSAWLPLDPSWPPERLHTMLEDAWQGQTARVLVGEAGASAPAAGELGSLATHALSLDLSSLELSPLEGQARVEARPHIPRVHPDNLAYVIYTSGSTGRPKGVAIPHRAVVNFLRAVVETPGLPEGGSLLAVTTLSFDISVLELFLPLLTGGRVVVASRATTRDGAGLAAILGHERIDLMQATPATWRLLLDAGWCGDPRLRMLSGGEALPSDLGAALLDRGGELWNMFGPTETTVWSAARRVGDDEAPARLGGPLHNTQLYVLDRRLGMVPAGVRGELFIAGAGLARGYRGRPALTAERFLPDPFGEASAHGRGARMYRVGDVVSWRADGTLEFLGRGDQQVKVRGFRVELGEIEAALRACPEVREAVVAALKETSGSYFLAAYVTATPGATIVEERLRGVLRRTLTEAMIPSVLTVLDELPRTLNDKIDRKRLPAPSQRSLAGTGVLEAPRDPLEEVLVAIWSEVLGVERLGVRDHFFALGGHSLRAARVVARLRTDLGVDLSMAALFQHPTVADLARHLRDLRGGTSLETAGVEPLPPLERAVGQEPRLSLGQERLWYFDQIHPGNPAYNMALSMRLAGRLDRQALETSLAALQQRQEVLRTVYPARDGNPTVRLADKAELDWVDLRACAESVDVVARTVQQEVRRPFDLGQGPLLRCLLLGLEDELHLLILTAHHIVADGGSLEVLGRELTALYASQVTGEALAFADLPVSYADYAVWQRRVMSAERLAGPLAFWRRQLAELPTIELTPDRSRPALRSFQGKTVSVGLDGEFAEGLQALTRRLGATSFMVHLAAFQLLLARSAGKTDIPVGAPLAQRDRPELEALIGFFVNILVIRTRLREELDAESLVRQVRDATLDAWDHRQLALEVLLEALGIERSASREPLFQVTFAEQTWLPAAEMAQLRWTPEAVDTHTAKFDLSLFVTHFSGRAGETAVSSRASLEYSSDLFDETTIRRLLEQYRIVLVAFASAPRRSLAEISLLSPSEAHQVLLEWNDTEHLTDRADLVHTAFERWADATPAATALAWQAGGAVDELCYGTLNACANRLAQRLLTAGVGLDVPVGILLERGPDLIVAILAVLKAGGAYLPIDPGNPEERIVYMLETALSPLVLTATPQAFPALRGEREGRRREVVCLDVSGGLAEPLGQMVPRPRPALTGSHLAYVIFTSGSTGRPKGVAVPHAGLANLTAWHRRNYAVTPADRATHLAGLGFDASVWELWPYLSSGARIQLVPDETIMAPESLPAWLDAHAISLSFLATPLAEAMMDRWPVGRAGLAAPRVILTGGDRLHRLPDPEMPFALVNHYGPTENSVVTTSGRVSRAAGSLAKPTLGSPISNTRVLLCDRSLRPVPQGVAGELCIAGSGLARGYLHRPGQTAERFVPHPAGIAGERLYRSGDLARWLPTGELEFLGRIDQQVKVRGFRVELGEVESVVRQHPEVLEVAALVAASASGVHRLVAFVVGAGRLTPSPDTLRQWLASRLPDYMIPASFVSLEALPLTVNGKIDRRQLLTRVETDEDPWVAPQGVLETRMAEIWSELLGVEKVGAREDFFALGGHSLHIARLVSRVRERLAAELSARTVFLRPTVAGLAAAVTESYGERCEQLAPEASEEELEAVLTRMRRLQAAGPVPRPRQAATFPLAPSQRRIWFLEQLQPDTATYNIAMALDLEGVCDRAALARGFELLVERHEMLRMAIDVQDGEPGQHPVEALWPGMLFTDLSSLPPEERAGKLEKVGLREARRPFDLSAGLLLRAHLLCLDPEHHRLVLVLHHLVADGWSVGILARELAELYRRAPAEQAAALAPLSLQYLDYVTWQQEVLEKGVWASQLDFWRTQLEGAQRDLPLPFDRPRPAQRSVAGAQRSVAWGAELADRLETFSERRRSTLFVSLLGVFNVLLYRYSQQTDISVASPVANRDHVETEGVVGLFANTLIFRTDLSGAPSFLELLARVREVVALGTAHQELPFEHLVRALDPQRSLGHAPLAQAMLSLEVHPVEPQLEGLSVRSQELDTGTAKFDLMLALRHTSQGLRGFLEYSTDLFDASTIDRLIGHARCLLKGVEDDPSRRISELPLLPEAERRLLLETWNQTTAPYPAESSLAALFDAQARRTPAADALWVAGERVSYEVLRIRSEHIARHLVGLGVGPEVLVAVLVPRGSAMVAALLGVLRAGGAYLPLDPEYPRERIAFMLEDTAAPLLLTTAELVLRLPETGPRRILVEELLATDPEIGAEALGRQGELAYVIYTSGSTGRPKGVAMTHQGAVDLVIWATGVFGREELSGVLASTSICFDLSIFELFVPLSCGGRVVLVPEALALDGLAELASVSLINTVPSVMTELLHLGAVPSSVRTINLAGEALARDLVQEIYATTAVARVLNLYGPSEDTTYSTFAEIERHESAPPAIGRPVANTRVYVLDAAAWPLPQGASGEGYLGGDNLARGYVGRAALTAERFLPDPFVSKPGARMYRTGDLLRYREGGVLEFLGRRDQQVKLRGFRIELGEVETMLRAHPAIQEAVVGLRHDPATGLRLVAWITARGEKFPGTGELRQFLGARLPAAMVPSVFVELAALPLTLNRKVDRKALPDPTAGELPGELAMTAPSTPLEELIAAQWQLLLGIDRVGVLDNFFERGGHSLLATRLVTRLRSTLGVDLPVRQIFETPTIAALAQSIAMRRQAAAYGSPAPPLTPSEASGPAPLSFEQERIWFLEQLTASSAVYNLPAALRWVGSLDEAALTRSCDDILRRHTALRTVFPMVANRPVQRVLPQSGLALSCCDLRWMPQDRRTALTENVVAALVEQPFDIERGPLCRMSLLRLGEREHLLVVAAHHMVADGFSMGVLLEELATSYTARVRGLPPSLHELPVQYADYARWQRDWLQGEALAERLEPWRKVLAGMPDLLPLPTDRPRSTQRSPRGGHLRFVIPAAQGDLFLAFCRSCGATPFMGLFGVFLTLLMRVTGSRDIPVGTPVANRGRREVEKLIGFFANTLVLRVPTAGGLDFQTLLTRVRDVALDAWGGQELPLAQLVEALRPERDLAHSPLFQVMFSVQQPLAAPELPGLRGQLQELVTGTAKFDLTLFVTPSTEGLRGLLEYSTDLFDRTTTTRFLGHLGCLVTAIVDDPRRPLGELPLLTPAEAQTVMVEWNDTARVSSETPVHQLVAAQARSAPEAVAVTDQAEQVTYGELDRRANRLAHYLRKLGVGPEAPAGVLLERTIDLVTGLLAVLKAGAAYVPLDPSYPGERIARMLATARTRVLLTHGSLCAQRLAGFEPAGEWLSVELDRLKEELERQSSADPGVPVSARHLAYVIFTSGSTGRPKGVALSHGGLSNLVAWHVEAYGVSSADRASHLAGLGFDAAVWELWPYLAAGASVHLAPDEVRVSPEALPRWLAKEAITLSFMATPLAEAVLAQEPLAVRGLRALLTGGDRLRTWPEGLSFSLFNHYGPTEGTVVSTVGRVSDRAAGRRRMAPPIGRPIRNQEVYLLDAGMRPVPLGVVGEVYVAGIGLARGYLHRPARTAASFLPNPFGRRPGRLYRTGDLARLRSDGEIEFLGRIDHQVKIRGFRIELGEIETALAALPGVAEVLVLAPEISRDRWLVAYWIGEALEEELRTALSRTLPAYMVPASFVRLAALPRTPNGKLDRSSLPLPHDLGTSARFVPPQTPMETTLATIWADLLGIERVGRHDDFFRLGGHSLLATQMVSRVREALGVELPLRRFFELPALVDLADELTSMAGHPLASRPMLEPRPRPSQLPLSYAQERLWFLDQLDPGTLAYNIPANVRLVGRLDRTALEKSLARMVARHEMLRTAFEAVDGVPVQRILDHVEVPIPHEDLAHLGPEDQQRTCNALTLEECNRPFDLRRPPLLRVRLLALGETHHVLLLTMHHIVADGWSIRILVRDLAHFYTVETGGSPAPLPELSVQYAEYALWQRSWLEGPESLAELRYWRRQLAVEIPILELPTDHPRSQVVGNRPGRYTLELSSELTQGVLVLVHRYETTPFMTLLAALKFLLHRLSGQERIVVGSPIAGRNQAATEPLIGIFLNTLALATQVSDAGTFPDLLRSVRETAQGAYAHQDLPFEKVLEELDPERDLSSTPLFQVFFNMLSLPPVQAEIPSLRLEEIEVPDVASKFDLTVYVRELERGLRFEWVYNAELFETRRIRTMARQYELLLAQMVADPERSLNEFSLAGGVTALPEPSLPLRKEWFGSVVERFLAAAGVMPEKIAIVDQQGAWSYRWLEVESRRVAADLCAGGLRRGEVVAVYGHRSASLLVALLATWRAGGAFLVLDPAYPAVAILHRLEPAEPQAWLAVRAAGDPPPEVVDWVASFVPGCRRTLGASSAGEPPVEALPDLPAAGDLAYVAFTSGSTGLPRGVLGAHRPLSHFLHWHQETFGLLSDDRFSVLSGLSHDPLLRDVLTPIWLGATCVLPSTESFSEPGWLAAWIARERIAISHLTPATARLLCEGETPSLPSLRRLFFGGDLLREDDVAQIVRRAPGARVVNFYGATETPQAMGWYEVSTLPGPVDGSQRRPARGRGLCLGRGIEGVQLLILRDQTHLAGVGELGEICIRTPYLAEGYLGLPELTAERFIRNPWTGDSGDRIYRTGDLGRYDLAGNVEYAGRADHQVKIRGYRVEPVEIAGLLKQHETVADATVGTVPELGEGNVLVAWVVPAAGVGMIVAEALKTFLASCLPAFMVPAFFVSMERLPLTPNGKLNRKALPLPRVDLEDAESAPRNATEAALTRIWQEVLGVDQLGIHTSFFELGGHSLLATRLLARIQRELGLSVSLRCLFEAPTIAGVAAAAQKTSETEAVPTIEPDKAARHERFPLTDIQEAYWVGRTGALELGQVASHRYLEIESVDLSIERLGEAWRRLIERHGVLRLVVHPDGWQQILAKVPRYEIEVIDLSRSERAEEEIQAIRERMSHQILGSDTWPLFEIRAARLAAGRVRLFFSFDFLIADAWSFQILLNELSVLYRTPEVVLPALDLSFRDCVLAERGLRGTPLYEQSREYWLARLPSLPPGPQLPQMRDAASLERQRFVRRSAQLAAEPWNRLKERAAAHGLTPSVLLLTAYSEVLATWSRSQRFSLVLTLFHRLPFHPQINRLVGDFTSTSLLEVVPYDGKHFAARGRRIQERLFQDLDHRYMSGVEVNRALARGSGQGARAATTVVFTSTLGLGGGELSTAEPLPGEVVYSVSQTPQVLLDHQVGERDGGLYFNWDAVEEIFAPGILHEMFDSYLRLLERLARDEESWHAPTLGLVSARELEPRNLANATAGPVPAGLLHTGFFEHAALRPGQPAVVTAGQTLGYGELADLAHRLGRGLRQRGAVPNTLVAVVMEKGWEQIAAVLGILSAGAAYLPIDANLPAERLAYLLENGQVELILTQPHLRDRLSWPLSTQVFAVERELFSELGGAVLETVQDALDLAYVIFTSGSTGQPKGVMIDHRGALNTCVDINHRFRVTSADRVLALSALNFDLSVYDVFGLLGAGGTVVLPEPTALRSPERWHELLTQEGVTVWNTVPALSEMLVETLEGRGQKLPATLRLVLLSGDWIPVHLPARIRALAPRRDLEIVSLGGATEVSIWSIYHPILEVSEKATSIPYGRPLANQSFEVLDPRLEPCPTWVPGELFIGGIGLAQGYWRDAQKTAASFFTHPRTGARLYRTGDLGRYLPNGEIEFLGREDFQVKIQGHRIELGEIETNLAEHPAVRLAAVTVHGKTNQDRRLVAYVVVQTAQAGAQDPPDTQPPAGEQLRAFLSTRVPAYMVPAVFVELESMPLTANGKVDRQALPVPALAAPKLAERARTHDPVEEILGGIWQEILEVEHVGPDSDFFELGGHSVLATRVATRVRVAFNVELPLARLFQKTRLADLAAEVHEARELKVRCGAIRLAPRDGELPLSFAQQRQWLTAQMEPNSPVYNVARGVRFRGPLSIECLGAAIREIVRRHETLRSLFPAENGRPLLRIAPVLEMPLPLVDLSGLAEEHRERAARQVHDAEARRLFDLAAGPLVRAVAVRWHEEMHDGLVTTHHIVSDEWSANLMLREMSLLYSAFLDGKPSPLPELTCQYVDYAHTQRLEMRQEELAQRMQYWRRHLAGAPAALELRTDYPRGRRRFAGGQEHTTLDEDLTRELRALSQREGVTLFTTLLAAFKVLLYHYSDQEDIIVGVPIASRDRIELEGLLGYFIDALALRTSVAGNPTFRELLARVREVVLGAHSHQDIPFEKLVEELRPKRAQNRPPFFQVTLNYYNGPMPAFEAAGLEVELLQMYRATAQYDLTLYLRERDGKLVGGLEYDQDLFRNATAQRMLQELAAILAASLEDPDRRLKELRNEITRRRKKDYMTESTKATRRVSRFKKIRRQSVALDSMDSVKISFLIEGSKLPLLIEPNDADLDLKTWAVGQREFIEEKLLEHGGLLFRGFGVPTPVSFYEIAEALCPELVNYFEGSSPRINVGGNDKVYTSTEYPAEHFVSLHNELSYAHKWPRKIFFHSVIPAKVGGETPIADSREIYRVIPEEIRQRFIRKGVKYVRNLHGGFGAGLSWQTVFETEDRAAVEAYCEEGDIEYRWRDDGGLWTSQIRPGVLRHPLTGQLLWYNQVHQFHPSNLRPEEEALMRSIFTDEDSLPINGFYGDGSPLEEDALAAVREAYDKVMVKFPWQKGDVLVLDNMLTAHGRMPFEGPRKTIVAMGETVRLADLSDAAAWATADHKITANAPK